MTCLGKKLAVAIPDTVLEERGSLRDKTVKLGQIARACAIYGVDVVEIFRDRGGTGEAELMTKVLGYLETPQYLRRRMYPLDEALKFAGLLPPLRIPSHKKKVALADVKVGEVREGLANPDGTVDVGLDRSAAIRERIPPGSRVTVRVVSSSPFAVETIPRDAVKEYWGYSLEVKDLAEVFSDARFGVKVATSRYGDPLGSRIPSLQEAVRRSDGVALVFGSPSRGLFEIAGKDLRAKADFTLNLFADQHVETVRTEEAIFAGLQLVNTLVS